MCFPVWTLITQKVEESDNKKKDYSSKEGCQNLAKIGTWSYLKWVPTIRLTVAYPKYIQFALHFFPLEMLISPAVARIVASITFML